MAKKRRNVCAAVERGIPSKGSQERGENAGSEIGMQEKVRTVDSILSEGDPNASVGLYQALNRQPVFYIF